MENVWGILRDDHRGSVCSACGGLEIEAHLLAPQIDFVPVQPQLGDRAKRINPEEDGETDEPGVNREDEIPRAKETVVMI